MRKFSASLATILISLCTFNSLGQATHWNTAPSKGFVFEINNKEAQKLLTISSPDTIFNGLLHTLIDTFNVDKGWTNRPAKGHFILARIIENKLHCEYTSVFPYQVFLLKEYDALSLQVLDMDGNVREDAKVKFKFKRLRIDPESKTYRIENDWFHGNKRIVTVELDDFRSVFNVQKHEVPSWYNDYYNDDDGPSFYSYMITDKNKYKPGEKVRFKSFALSHSKSPLHKDLQIWLLTGSKSVKVGDVAPHRPGSFAGEFQLHDSLNLKLDRNYTLQLREKKGRIVASCNFKYEDYELNGNRLEVKLATTKQFHPTKNEISITATDVNGLILKDAKASVVVRTQTIRETFQPLVILSDTLMIAEIDLDANNATVVDIPSNLFQKTNTFYQVNVSVTNSQNQRMERSLTAMHYYSQYELTTRFSNDSIIYEVLNNGELMADVPMEIKHNDEVNGTKITLPYKEKLNPIISSVQLNGNFVSRKIFMRDLVPKIELKGGIEKDSFNIRLHNPQKLEVSWFIYKGSQLIQKGFGNELEFTSLIEERTQTYYVELLYSFGGEDHIKRQDYEFKEGFLDVTLAIPDRIFPGQQVEATIQVNDQSGWPVSGVDLTAVATTAKLNHYLPDLPYYGSSSTPRSKKAHYTKDDINKRTAILDLDYKKWEKRARLDTMKYYQFTYPSSQFSEAVHINDGTQFAPFVMQNGRAKQIHVIEVNRKPVYYSWVDQPNAYSFYVSPDRKQQITLRLFDRVLVLDSMLFEVGMKTILSIDLDHLPENVKVIKMDPVIERTRKNRNIKRYAFTSTEINRHLSYIAAFKRSDGHVYLESREEFTPLFGGPLPSQKPTIIVGPITPSKQTFHDVNTTTTYQHTGGYTYAFEDNLVYKLNAADLIPKYLSNNTFSPMTIINDSVMTKKYFLEYKEEESKWLTRVIDLVDQSTRLNVLLPEDIKLSGVAVFLFENCSTKEIISPCENYSRSGADFYTIPRGCYNAIVLYNNSTYLKMDSINLKSHTQVVIDFTHAEIQPANALSDTWRSTPSNNCYGKISYPMSRSIAMNYSKMVVGNVRGTIYDESNMELAGANIVVKGTTNGTVADVDGRFALDIDEPYATLVITFIGYVSKEIEVRIGSEISVSLAPDIMQLSEIVVVGYGATSRSELTGALSGRVAGVSISNPDKVEVNVEDESEKIKEAERQLYQELLSLNTIRSNFSDVGFWEPRLYTDKQGQSKFKVTFPDDITRWDATVYAMNRYLQTGTARTTIKSYKPLMAELHVPQFLTQGDSAFFLGKVLNYTSDKDIIGKVKWSGANTDFEKGIHFTEFHIDKLPVNATTLDSITTQYVFTRDDGYMDGEERTVSVVEQGIIRADGTLSILQNNEDVHVKASDRETVTIEILDNQIDIYTGEINYLLNYKYACNEQLASKLIGLVNYKLLMQYEGKPFRYDKDLNKIIVRLLKNQNQEFLWSWWDVSPNTSFWMSAHILRALKVASDAGYKVDLNIDNIVRKVEYKFDFLHQYTLSDTDLLHALATWGAKTKYSYYLVKLDSIVGETENQISSRTRTRYYYPYSLLKDKMLLYEIRQLVNLPYQRDSLMRYKKDGIMGDVYFSENKPARYWYEDGLDANAIAYRIVKRDSLLKDLIVPMQMYFLSLRKKGGWNTYQSANVLLSVLPDLLAEGVSKGNQATLNVTGKVNASITKFPYRIELQPHEELTIHKESGLPLYYIQYVKERVTKAKTGVEGFEISTSLGDNKILEAGKPVSLVVEVNVKKDATAENVMIEVPIPGACSYADKTQNNNRIETHREYFKERTVIFCENMKPGRYTFVVHLLPRFTGNYILNPAQVSLMYVPVVNANTDLKRVLAK